jgi:hypothetical protein
VQHEGQHRRQWQPVLAFVMKQYLGNVGQQTQRHCRIDRRLVLE